MVQTKQDVAGWSQMHHWNFECTQKLSTEAEINTENILWRIIKGKTENEDTREKKEVYLRGRGLSGIQNR